MDCMAFSGYSSKGIYPWAHADIVPAITEISRGAGVPGISMYCYQPNGVGHHKTGRAADIQAGSVANAKYIHATIAFYILQNWKRLRVRYMAWNGYEYVETTRARQQTKNYGGTDPFHKRHVHVDFYPGSIPGANPNVAIGGGLIGNPDPAVSTKYYIGVVDGVPDELTYFAMQRFLKDRGFYRGTINGTSNHIMWEGLQLFLRYIRHQTGPATAGPTLDAGRGLQRWLTKTGHYKGPINGLWNSTTWRAFQTYLSYATPSTIVYIESGGMVESTGPTDQSFTPNTSNTAKKDGFLVSLSNAQQAQVYKQTMNISAAVNRNEQRNKEMLQVLAQQSEILLGILAQVSNQENPNPALTAQVQATNLSIQRSEVMREAGETVGTYAGDFPTFPDTPPDDVEEV